jgi:hypothetical protein
MLLPETSSLSIDDLLTRYRADGFARVGPTLDAAGVKALGEQANAIMLGELKYPTLFFQHDSTSGLYEDLELKRGNIGPSLAYRKIEKLEVDPLFRAWIQNDLFGRIARAWYGEDHITVYRAVLFTKAAKGGTVLPWHQDGGTYWGLDRAPTLQIWTALDDAPEAAGCVRVIPGSHVDGLATPLGGVVPKNHLAKRDVDKESVLVPARAGESLLIHNDLWHSSGVNTTDLPRRALTICYMSAATKCLRKKRAPRNFFKAF